MGAAVVAFTLGGLGQVSQAAPDMDNAQGKSEQGNGRSICYFSGLNDDPSEGFPFDGRVQSFGQLVKRLGPLGGVPGTECNPNRGEDMKPRG